MSVMNQINAKREVLRTDGEMPPFVDGIYVQAEALAQNALKKLKSRKIRDSKISLMASISYQELAERNIKQIKEIRDKIDQATASTNDRK